MRRMSEITQQTLRFYRQSTLPARATMEELLDSVLDMYSARLETLGIALERQYDPESRSVLLCGRDPAGDCEPGEQCDGRNARAEGGCMLRARRSRDWVHPQHEGVRITIADTGSGMTEEVQGTAVRGIFYDQGGDGDRAGALGESRDHPEASWNDPSAQPGGDGREERRVRCSRSSFLTMRS